jgi:hypothetical protein
MTFTTPTSRPEPDELDERIRLLNAERMRPSPPPLPSKRPKRRIENPLDDQRLASLLHQTIDILAIGLYDPHDWRPLE